jgi:SAM-dependent methyltransferase
MSNDAGRPSPGPTVGDATFDAYYFKHCCGEPYQRDERWMRFFGGIADQIVSGIQPKRVLDAGCALGLLVEALRTRGVDAHGVDLSSYAIANVAEPMKPFCTHGSIADDFADRYDLIVSIEVVEHMPARDAEKAVANICRHADDVLFSSSPADYREPSHVNVQPPEHWAELFAREGFYRDIDYDASFITPWAVRFRRSSEPLPRIVRSYERRAWALTFAATEARSFATQVQRQLAEALERLSAAEEKHAEAVSRQLETERERGAAEAKRIQTEGELAQVRSQLAHALETITHMERSLFWKARRVWTTVARWAGRSN